MEGKSNRDSSEPSADSLDDYLCFIGIKRLWWTMLKIAIAVPFYIYGVYNDLSLAACYFNNGHITYFAITVTFIAMPALVCLVFTVLREIDNSVGSSDNDETTGCKPYCIFLFFHVVSISRRIQAFWIGIKICCSKDEYNKKTYHKKLSEFIEADFVWSHIEAFTQSGPQLVLQMSILAYNNQQGSISEIFLNLQTISILISTLMMALELSDFYERKKNESIFATVFFAMWHFCMIGVRIIAMSLFASIYHWWIVIDCLLRWIIMTFWVSRQETDISKSILQSAFYALLLMFTLNTTDKKLHKRSTITSFYVLDFFENTILLLVWYCHANQSTWFYSYALIVELELFALGIVLMLIHLLIKKVYKIHQRAKIY